MTQLSLTPEDSPSQELTVPQLLRIAITHGDAEKNIGVVERLIALQERKEAKEAERAFAIAFHALQQEMTGVQALDEVPDKNGNVKYTFASYERIMGQVRPLLLKHGFSVTFDSEFKEVRLVMRCSLIHVGGHTRTSTTMHRVASVHGANDAQNDGATATMAKRYALCQALNIVIEREGGLDVRNEGVPVTYEQAETLRELVRETKSNEPRFLAYAGAKTYEEIGSNRYQELFRSLQAKKEGAR